MLLGARAQEALEYFEEVLEYADRAIAVGIQLDAGLEVTYCARARYLEQPKRIPDAIQTRETLIKFLERKHGKKAIIGHTDSLVALYREVGDEAKALALEERARVAEKPKKKK
jgi:tetratricopeptide (TPR) repeat protein